MQQAQAEMDTIAAGLGKEFPAFDTGWGVRVFSLRDELAGNIRPALLPRRGRRLRAVDRLRERRQPCWLAAPHVTARSRFAARSGPRESGVMRQLLTESLVLGLTGGRSVSWSRSGACDALVAMSPVDLTTLGHIRLQLSGAAVYRGGVAAIVCGLAPAFRGRGRTFRNR